jgi:diadenosine tetraphosphate (Ap4A) HIT family hydrolase
VGDCAVCLKHRGAGPLLGEKLWEDELVLAFHAPLEDGRAYLGHLLVETRRHVPALAGLAGDEAAAVGRVAARLAAALERVAGAEHVHVAVVGRRIPHFHLHVLPRYAGTPPEYSWHDVDEWPEMRRGADEVASLSRRLRAALAG